LLSGHGLQESHPVEESHGSTGRSKVKNWLSSAEGFHLRWSVIQDTSEWRNTRVVPAASGCTGSIGGGETVKDHHFLQASSVALSTLAPKQPNSCSQSSSNTNSPIIYIYVYMGGKHKLYHVTMSSQVVKETILTESFALDGQSAKVTDRWSV